MWSGFLDASAVEPGTKLHYWFAAAETPDWASPSTPVTLWLNGGPGSSSILGMLQEMGPLIINATGGLMRNPYAWTKQTNLLILESPGGVGYSYCAAYPNCANTDISVAAAARASLQDFFKTKFPELKGSKFYITGESYAGVYIPTLTDEILTHAPEIRMSGIAVGDPCTDRKTQTQSMDMLWYAHKHGFVPDDEYDFLVNNCSATHPSFLAQGEWHRESSRWATTSQRRAESSVACTVANRKFLATTSKGLSQSWKGSYINELNVFADAAALDWTLPGTLNYFNAQWMNRDDVKKALHVDMAPVGAWPGPPDGWSYKSDWDACNYAPGNASMIDLYRKIAPQLERTIVFNGDVDPCVSYEGTRNAIAQVGFPVLPGGSYRPWFYNKSATNVHELLEKPALFGAGLELRDAGAQFGGHVVNYEHDLSFATVHGSGHMVPQFQPQSAERLLSQLLGGGQYVFTPAMATDKELAAMTDDQFDANVDAWTKLAQNNI